MNLPEIRFTRPRFSLRFFIYLLFGLVILVLTVEGGYYFYYRFQHQFGNMLIIGRVKAKEGRVLLIEQKSNPAGKKIRVEVAPDARFFERTVFGSSETAEILSSTPDFLNDLDIDDIVILLELKPRLLKEPMVTKIILFQLKPEQ